MYQHQTTLFSQFLWLQKRGNSIFSHSFFLSILKSEAGLRSKGEVFWEVVEAWALCQGPDDAFASVLEKLPHICRWTQTASPWWQGWRCCCTQLWTKGDTCLTWGLTKAADSPQGDAKGERFSSQYAKHFHFTDCGDMLHTWNGSPRAPAPKTGAFLVATLSCTVNFKPKLQVFELQPHLHCGFPPLQNRFIGF